MQTSIFINRLEPLVKCIDWESKLNTVKTLLSLVIFVSSFLFVSCSNITDNLNNIEYNPNVKPGQFKVSNLEKESSNNTKITFALNKALADYPDLSSMLEADLIDGGDNSYIYQGTDSFFTTLQTFSDENYNKAKSMFPEITEDEFYYSASVGYMVANKEEININLGNELNLYENKDSLILNPTFDEVMSTGFWMSFASSYFGIQLEEGGLIFDDIENPLDEKANLDFMTKYQLAMRAALTRKNTQTIERRKDNNQKFDRVGSKKFPNNFMTEQTLKWLYEAGLHKGSYNLLDPFIEIGTGSTYFCMTTNKAQEDVSFDDGVVRIGHVAKAGADYLNTLFTKDEAGSAQPWTFSASILNGILAKYNILGEMIMRWFEVNND